MAEPARKIDFSPNEEEHGWQPRVIVGGGEGGEGGEKPNLRVIEGGAGNTIETPSQEAKQGRGHLSLVPALNEAENKPSAPNAPATKNNLSAQEDGVKMPSAEDMYKRSAENRSKGGKRGIFIGFGAGGGLVGIVGGFAFMLPFKLIGIMDNVIDTAGKRAEHVVESRAEKFFLQYVIRGSNAAVGGADFIATGNPIGDIFANIRTSRFESQLQQKYGLKIERGENGAVRISHDGSPLGDFKNADELAQYLNRDDLSSKDLRAAFKLISKNEFGSWRWFKRAKFVKWLRLKYKIPRFGSEKQKDGQSDKDYTNQVEGQIEQQVGEAEAENMADAIDCVASSGDSCNGADGDTADLKNTTDNPSVDQQGTDALKQAADQAVADSAKEVTEKGAQVGSKTIMERISGSVIGKAAGAVPFLGEIDFMVRMMYGIQNGAKNSSLQKMHANYMKRVYIMLFATIAGFSDQTKAGDLGMATVGALADQYTGSEAAQSWNFIQSKTLNGQGLSYLQKIGESQQNPEWMRTLATIGQYANPAVWLWFHSVSFVIDKIGSLTSKIFDLIPGYTAAMNAISGVFSKLFTDFLLLIGMGVDPQVVGPLRHLFTFAGATAAFDDNGKDTGMRKLTHDQALQIDKEAYQEDQQTLAAESFGDRIFNLDNSDSLLSKMIQSTPTPSQNDPIGSLAFAGAGMLGHAPTDLANIVTPSAMADSTAIPEDIADGIPIGATDTDLSAPFSMNIDSQENPCPTTADGSTFNTCLVDQNVAEAVGCGFAGSNCADIKLGDNQDGFSTDMFDTYADYDHRFDQPTPDQTTMFAKIYQAFGFLAGTLPVAALEVSRRKPWQLN